MAYTPPVKSITIQDLMTQLQSSPKSMRIIDIRDSFNGSFNQIPHSESVQKQNLHDVLLHSKDLLVVVYCQNGLQSSSVVDEWHELGHTNIQSLIGGFFLWEQAGFPTTQRHTLTPDSHHNARYARQIQLPQIGPTGQNKILKSRILIVGMGGLGCPASQYLVASGVGQLGLVDFDCVDISNLQRQILFKESDVGKLKVDCAKSALQKLNSHVNIQTYPVRLDRDNAQSIFENYDIILQGTDSFKTRYIVNEMCREMHKPLIEGAVQEFSGHIAVFDFRREDSPCYQCVFPSPPPQDTRLSCSEIGVLGVLPGLIGTWQASETLKLILEIGQTLSHKLLLYDGLNNTQKTFTLQQNPQCPICHK